MDNSSTTNNMRNGSQNGFKLGDFSIDEYRPMKVIAIGAGMSGILAAIRYSILDFALGPFISHL